MGRAPCCEKMGLKKGPWTREEDQILVAYIQRYGHGNWRALPKQAGLLRCGKSCRLRWTNYLRPDIKRGNFSKEEDDTIINLHKLLGNRWSAIAARLPGRTDNEIKNVWHTHLKKRVKSNPAPRGPDLKADPECHATMAMESKPITLQLNPDFAYPRCQNPSFIPTSPPQSSSEFSSQGTDSSTPTRENYDVMMIKEEYPGESEKLPRDDDEHFWSEALSVETFGAIPFSSPIESFPLNSSMDEDNLDYWLRVLMESGDLSELPNI